MYKGCEGTLVRSGKKIATSQSTERQGVEIGRKSENFVNSGGYVFDRKGIDERKKASQNMLKKVQL